MIASKALVPAVAVMICCAPAAAAHREVAPMHIHSFGSDTLVRSAFTVEVTGIRTSGHNVVDSAPQRESEMTLEEAFAEWAQESQEIADEMWHHSASDTRDV
jgi:hypothetical protein